MADITPKQKRTILSPNLSQAKKAMLLQITQLPGWRVVEEIANEACLVFTQDILKLDPESEDYERVNIVRTLRARHASEFSDLFFKSVVEHANSIRQAEQTEEQEAAESVGAAFGIHPAKPGAPADAIRRTFGIHPARPKKADKK